MTPLFAAVDLGASSARLLAGRHQDGRLAVSEMARLPNGPVRLPDGLHWDVLRIHQAMLEGLAKLSRQQDGRLSVGVDGWGVDYGLVDEAGHLLGAPFHYRDSRTHGRLAQAEATAGPGRIYEATGIQTMEINTLFQLMAEREGAAYAAASDLLLFPDLIGYLLTGQRRFERTNASTTQLVDVRTGRVVPWLLRMFGLREDIFPAPAAPGDVLGPVLGEVAAGVGMAGPVEVVCVGSHDTASAVLAVPALTDSFAYVISGTWSLAGLELGSAVVDTATREANFSNEVGTDGTFRFLRNVMGHWMLQECERVWGLSGQARPIAELLGQAAECAAFHSVLDVGEAQFASPGDMPSLVRAACAQAGEPVPESQAAVVRCVVDSMALAIASALEDAQRCAGRSVGTVHLVGGGVANELLLRLVASATGLPVVAGPVEASAVGNILVQMRSAGLIGDRQEMRALVARSFPLARYLPEPQLARSAAEARRRLRRGAPVAVRE